MVARAEAAAVVDLVRSFDPGDWERPTECGSWFVRHVVAHVVGACEDSIRPWVFVRHAITGRRRYPRMHWLDGLNEAQVDDRRSAPPARLVADLERLAARAVEARRRTPAPLRRLPTPDPLEGGDLGYLVDTIYPRDQWMHRLDLARATERPFALDDHDRDVVEQVVRDLHHRWDGAAVTVDLDGPAGGRWVVGGGEPIADATADAVEFMRWLSGRDAVPPEVSGDPALTAAFLEVRVPF